MWEIVAVAAISSILGGKSRKTPAYQPNPTWLKMQEDIMTSIDKGLAAGGYTWDDTTNENLKRLAVESAAIPYKGAQERVVSQMAPYGNIGAMGRGLVGLNTARAQDESTALRTIDVKREEQRLGSFNQLMGLGAGIQDPNLPQNQINAINAQRPSTAQMVGSGLATGLGTKMNLDQAEANMNFWNRFTPNQSMGLINSPKTVDYTRYLGRSSGGTT